MADAPPPIASSAAQASFQAKAAADIRDLRRAGQAHTASARAQTTAEESTTVETADSDTAVFTNAEGSGSQGRASDQGTPDISGSSDSGQQALHTGDDGLFHIDIRA